MIIGLAGGHAEIIEWLDERIDLICGLRVEAGTLVAFGLELCPRQCSLMFKSSGPESSLVKPAVNRRIIKIPLSKRRLISLTAK